jgi:hypothetical protein
MERVGICGRLVVCVEGWCYVEGLVVCVGTGVMWRVGGITVCGVLVICVEGWCRCGGLVLCGGLVVCGGVGVMWRGWWYVEG